MNVQITDSLAVKWPENLKELFLDTYIKTNVEEYLRALPKGSFPAIVNEGASFTIEGEEKKLEHTLVFLYDSNNRIKHIILTFDHRLIFERGFQREVKKCYDLVKGKFRVEKAVFEKEKVLLESFQGIEGIPKCYGFFERFNPQTNENQIFTIERYYDNGNLDTVLLNESLTTNQKLKMIHCLLSALKTLHLNSFLHLDIKLENITLRKLIPVLNDYGNINVIDEGIGPWLYFPPEYYDFLRTIKFDKPSSEQFIKYNSNFGKARDVWALGIVFLCIIKNCLFEKYYLTFLGRAFAPAFVTINDKRQLFPKKVFHSQEVLQEEFKSLTNSTQDVSLIKALRIVEKMLNFNPEKRLSAPKAFEEIDQIIPQFGVR